MLNNVIYLYNVHLCYTMLHTCTMYYVCYTMLYTCKMYYVHGHSALQFNDFFKFSNSSRTRGHNLRLETPLIKNNTRRNFFAHRIIKPWNALPTTIVNSHSTKSFKRQISNLDLSLYLKYPCIPHNP
jgi:hypothetical protein